MNTRLLLIIGILLVVFVFPLGTVDKAYALCTPEINYDSKLKESELVFTGTVTRLDNYDGPQKVTFFIHELIKGEINTPKYILENSGLIFHENDSITSSSVSVDYKIGKTYKVYVENGETNRCTTKITPPPADYIWEPGPEDGKGDEVKALEKIGYTHAFVDARDIKGKNIECGAPGLTSKEQCEYEKLVREIFLPLAIAFPIVGISTFMIWRKRK